MPRKLLSAIILSRAKRAPLQQQLVASLKEAVRKGQVLPGEAFPSSRALAQDLKISRNTVLIAYDQLLGEGYLESRPRSGLFVSTALTKQALAGKYSSPGAQPVGLALTKQSRLVGPPRFRPCQPDVGLFPLAAWNRSRNRVLKAQGMSLLHYQPNHTLGVPVLRRALAEYLRDSRGVRCHWEQIAITNGSQQALYLLSRLLLAPGISAYLEDPGYLGARLAFRYVGAKIAPVPVDRDGIVPPTTLAPRSVIYVTPSRQFPTGASLPVARRLALIELLKPSHSWLIEDDYDSEFRYTSAPLPSLQGLDSTGRVIYTGTMSKVLFPSLRIGYVVLPESLVEKFSQARGVVDEQGSLIDQAALADFISNGTFHRHIRRCRKVYAARQKTFLEAATDLRLPLEFPYPGGGMSLMGLWTRSIATDAKLRQRIAESELGVTLLSRYSLNATRRGLVFGYTALDHNAIRTALRQFAALCA
jgi:GntR family transcriptional regulator / MocR family aminotransferase